MAKTSFIEITPDNEDLYFKSLQIGDSFNLGKVIKKPAPPSRQKIKGLTQRSLLPQIAEIWNGLTLVQQGLWTSAGSCCGLNGYRLFVQNMSARLEYGFAGAGTPSLLHQYKVGHINISSPATFISIIQPHPLSYWILRKVAGTKGQYQPVNILENFRLPLTISLNCKSNLVSSGPNPSVKFYAKIWYSYQGVDCYQDVSILIPLVHDWQTLSAVSPSIIGQIIAYDLYFTLQDVRGDLWFDNLTSFHSSQNWARDPYCNNINEEFTKIWYQIPKAWAPVELPDGASYGSVFPDVV